MSTSVRRTLEVAALAAVLASTATLAVSAIATAPQSVAPLKAPHTEWVGTPCATDPVVGVTQIWMVDNPATGHACIQVDSTMADLRPNPITPAEAAAWTPYAGPIPPCGPTAFPYADCVAAPVEPPKALTGFDLPAGATITVRVAGGAGEIQTCSHSKGAGTGPGGVPVSGDGWDCSRLTPPKFVPRTSHRDQ